jgi:alpha-1,3-glucosyltransferase
MQKYILIVIILIALLYRTLVSLGPHSGFRKGPKYGDFEAQRHWMEITRFTPIGEWYHNTTLNNLEYWGLDYPPLTAYHSLLCSYFAPRKSIELTKSRGQESLETRLFMRLTVTFSDLLMMILPLVLIAKQVFNKQQVNQLSYWWSLLYVLIQPCIVLIDHGHFQYNSVSIGFALWAIYCLMQSESNDSVFYTCLGSALFCCSLNFKQMALYYSLPFFCYLTGRCIKLFRRKSFVSGLSLFVAIGITVIASFAIIWLPFLSSKQFPQVVKRIFPVGRGLFEDKVANIWCSLSLVYKVHRNFSTDSIIKLSALLTLASSSLSCLNLLFNPTIIRFAYALVNVSMSFFLWSYHVHEKTIIFVTIPAGLVLLLLNRNNDKDFRVYNTLYHWFVIIATFSMYPLLERDEISIAYIASMIAYTIITLMNDFDPYSQTPPNSSSSALRKLVWLSIFGAITIHIIMAGAPISKRYPDLYTFMCTVYSCIHFILFMIYCNYKQWTVSEPKLKVG